MRVSITPSRSPPHRKSSLQDECGRLLQFFLSAVEFGVFVAGLLLATPFLWVMFCFLQDEEEEEEEDGIHVYSP